MSLQKYDFENSIGFIVNRTARAFVKALDSELREKVGITVGQWKVIVMLVNQNGLTQKEIADKLGLEGPTLIPIIDKMEKERLVVRKVDVDDRRNNRIYRTEKANELWNKMLECATNIRKVSLKNIPEKDIDVMKNVLEKIWHNLRIEFDVGDVSCSSSADNITTVGMKNSVIASTNEPLSNITTNRTTTTSALTSTRRKNRKHQEKGS
ncbi:MAG TPA: MarR family winged helix-turn-helix transcriptional regulator [Nitrososphaeraceae archaeon]|nr:MarR family winged helix-turn-helix transcriptional regulator [Nitrososphaeraceae archaeon]